MTSQADKSQQLEALLQQITDLAQQYYDLTGRPLGATGEVGEYWANRLFDLELEVVRSPGYDATDLISGKTVQIKTRLVQKPTNYLGETIGKFDLKKPWDVAMVVVLQNGFDPLAIYEASRENVIAALSRPGNKARAQGKLTIGAFKLHAKAKQIWPKPQEDAQIS